MSRAAITGIVTLLVLLTVPALATTQGYPGEVWLNTQDPAGYSFPLTGSALYTGPDGLYLCGGYYNGAARNLSYCTKNSGVGNIGDVDPPQKSGGGRVDMAFTTYHGKWYAMGGWNKTPNGQIYTFNDTQVSSDFGATWTTVNSSSKWLPRAFSAAVVFNNAIFMTGGLNATSSATYTDVWFLDAANESAAVWTKATNNSPFGTRYGHGMVALDGKMCVFGGTTDAAATSFRGDSWCSIDGTTWALAGSDAGRLKIYSFGYTSWHIPGGQTLGIAATGIDSTSTWNPRVSGTFDGATWFDLNATPNIPGTGPGADVMRLTNFTPLSTSANPYSSQGLYLLGMWDSNILDRLTMPKPVASATPISASGSTPFAVYWTDTTRGYGSSWTWDFKDGYLSYTENASHVFTSTGTFPVLFTVDSYFGESQSTLNVSVAVQQSQIQYFTQHLVQLKAVDSYGDPLPNANITVTYLSSNLPNTSTTWCVSAFGVSPEVCDEMMNGGIAASGTTGNDGSASFMMFPALRYGITIQNPAVGLNHYTTLSPADLSYVIYCPLSSQVTGNSTQAQLGNTSLWVTFPSVNWVQFHFGYMDTSGLTQYVNYSVVQYANVSTHNAGLPKSVYRANFTPGTGYVHDDTFQALNQWGDEYQLLYNATRSAAF